MAARAAIVTGASSGIGLAIAEMLGEEGVALTLTARRDDRLQRAAAQVRRRATAETLAVTSDVSSESDIARVLQLHREHYGRLDILVNSAGTGIYAPIEDLTTKHMDLQYAVNLRSIMLFYRGAIDLLREAGANAGALVVNIASISGKMGSENLSVYSATKHGVVGFTQAMNHELLAAGIRSCVFCPGFVDTPLSDYMKSDVPPHRMIPPRDLAEAVRFLLRTSAHSVVPEMIFTGPGDVLGGSQRQPLSGDGRAVSVEDPGA